MRRTLNTASAIDLFPFTMRTQLLGFPKQFTKLSVSLNGSVQGLTEEANFVAYRLDKVELSGGQTSPAPRPIPVLRGVQDWFSASSRWWVVRSSSLASLASCTSVCLVLCSKSSRAASL